MSCTYLAHYELESVSFIIIIISTIIIIIIVVVVVVVVVIIVIIIIIIITIIIIIIVVIIIIEILGLVAGWGPAGLDKQRRRNSGGVLHSAH